MPTITLTPQEVVRTGLAPVYTAAGASPLLNTSDTFVFNNTGRELLHFKKSGAGSCNVVITPPGTVDGLAVAARTVAVPATTGDKMIGPFPPAIYNTPGASTFVGFTVSEVTGLTVAIVRLP
jgi:hypothetical protein